MTEKYDNSVIIWYVANGIDAMRNCLVFHNKKASETDVFMFAHLEKRMRDYCAKAKIKYYNHDLFKKNRYGWVFSGAGWLAHIQENIRVVESVPEMSELYNTYLAMRRSWAEIRRIEAREDEFSGISDKETQELVKAEWVQAVMDYDTTRVVTRG